MAWYSKDYSYPVNRESFPHRLKDENGKSYTGENAFNNRHKLGWIDVPNPPEYDPANLELVWLGHQWYVTHRSKTEEDNFWETIRQSRDKFLLQSDWTQVKSSNTFINDIAVSSDANYSVFSMTSNNATIAVDDTVTFGSVTGIVTDVYMIKPDFDEEANNQPDDVVTVQTKMTESIANGSIINFTSAANTEVSFTGIVGVSNVLGYLIEDVEIGHDITSGSSTGTVSKLMSNTTTHIFRVPVKTDIIEGSTITFTEGGVSFTGTVDSVNSSVAYGYPGNYIGEDDSSESAIYRQKLRDITETYAANTDSFTWP